MTPPDLLTGLRETLASSTRSDYCVGYFNLRGWKGLDDLVERWTGGDGSQCRLLIGMQTSSADDLRRAMSLVGADDRIDNAGALRLRLKMADEFRQQLTFGAPTNVDEAGLRRLSAQLRARKVVVKLFLRHNLHAKLYLNYRPDPASPIVGFVGSSNLTMAGLVHQGELNVDVLDHDACEKLRKWFEDRWSDRFCWDITDELAQVIDESWAREEPVPPYLVYLKMAYHLSREAQEGIAEFRIPPDFGATLFDFQVKAVQIAAHHLNKRGGVMIGDVVGLGKTLMATAVAKIFEDDQHLETLIICPKNLVKMWQDYVDQYRLYARVVSVTSVEKELPQLRRFRVVLIDESHNLRNREGKRHKLIADYIDRNDSRVILLSATPYNKEYADLGSQLGLFVGNDQDLGVRPEAAIRAISEVEFIRRHQCGLQTLAAFEQSTYVDDWRELMRLFLVRRTRTFIRNNYASTDPDNGRQYLLLADGERSYFPDRIPKTVKFHIDESSPDDPYARLYSPNVVDTIDRLALPRYGLGGYLARSRQVQPTPAERDIIDGLGRARQRLIGFCRTNLFKRLESGGPAFIQSVERHALRNFVYLHALENGLPLPIGTQDAVFLDESRTDEDADVVTPWFSANEDVDDETTTESTVSGSGVRTEGDYRRRAADVYAAYEAQYRRRFKWIRPALFEAAMLQKDLLDDARALIDLLQTCGAWDPSRDAKLASLENLLEGTHPDQKVLVFTQFADTVHYLEKELRARGVKGMLGVVGSDADPTQAAWRFSPESNKRRDQVSPADELRVLIATDVLSEGQNLQDCSIVVNYDLPWAIVRLVQRAGRVDRIGQRAPTILCYSFLPAAGIESVIRLRQRVRQRLTENAEVVGTDEAFFEDETTDRMLDLYNEKAGILDGDEDGEVDLASEAYQVWKSAIDADPSLRGKVEALPGVVYSAKAHTAGVGRPLGALAFVETAQGNDALAWVDDAGSVVSQSTVSIFRAAACEPDTLAMPRSEKHHELVAQAVRHILTEESSPGGQLGRPSGARFKTYERLKRYEAAVAGTIFWREELPRAIEDVYRFPLLQSATDALNRQLRAQIEDHALADLVIRLRDEGALCKVSEEGEYREPRIICSMGLVPEGPA